MWYVEDIVNALHGARIRNIDLPKDRSTIRFVFATQDRSSEQPPTGVQLTCQFSKISELLASVWTRTSNLTVSVGWDRAVRMPDMCCGELTITDVQYTKLAGASFRMTFVTVTPRWSADSHGTYSITAEVLEACIGDDPLSRVAMQWTKLGCGR